MQIPECMEMPCFAHAAITLKHINLKKAIIDPSLNIELAVLFILS